MLRKLLNRIFPSGGAIAPMVPHEHSGLSAGEVADRLIAEGNRAESKGNYREACEQYRKAVDAAPGSAKAHLNLGIGLEAAGDAPGAIQSYEAALAIDPGNPYACYNLANVLYAREAFDQAERLLHSALDRQPAFPEAHVALSNIYGSRGNPSAAAASLEAALKLRPDYVGALYNYGLVLRELRRLAEAETALRRAIEIDPGSLSAYQALGAVLRDQARIGESIEVFRAAHQLAPERLDLVSAELFTLNFFDDISGAVLFARHKAFGEQLESAVAPRFGLFRNIRTPERRLRIGYVSSDFYMHPVGVFIIPLLERHDRSAYGIYCYSSGTKVDDVTGQIRAMADVWRDVALMSDAELADTVNRDAIDILIDLSGHSGVFRLGVFARQPAPLQVTWLGYLNTTGLTRIQYRLTDRYADPPGMADQRHTETLYRLPGSQWCYRPFISVDIPEEPAFRRNGFITFGSFNHISKISRTARVLWAEILTRLPDSRLVIVGVPDGQARESLLHDLEHAGVAATRITVVPRVPLDEYYQWFNAVDIALDTTPYSGGTTTCDTLWMGVPVITVQGCLPASRSAASILSTVGLSSWIASTPQDYVRFAVDYACEKAVITRLRRSLRQMMRESPIMDEPRFARDVEDAYRRMWHTWCDGARP
jgi:predicted O-linked N-acetylglucosamine transferase (SPINDLY family)